MDNNEKLSKKNIDDRYIFAEYDTIKEEMNCMNRLQIYSLHVSVLASLTVIGVLSQLKEVLLILFYIPFYNVSFFIIASQYQINMRINHYLHKSCENRPVWGARQFQALWHLLKGFFVSINYLSEKEGFLMA